VIKLTITSLNVRVIKFHQTTRTI